jgi:hypothetical protein
MDYNLDLMEAGPVSFFWFSFVCFVMDASFGFMSFFPHLCRSRKPSRPTVRVCQIMVGYVEGFDAKIEEAIRLLFRFFEFAIVS